MRLFQQTGSAAAADRSHCSHQPSTASEPCEVTAASPAGHRPTSVSTFGFKLPAVSTPATRRESSMGGAEVPTAMRGDGVT